MRHTVLEAKMKQTNKRPIIFVAHSLGGIVVKSVSALPTASAALLTATGSHPLRCGPPRRPRRAPLDQAVDVRHPIHGYTTPRRQRRSARQADGERGVGVCGGRRPAVAAPGARLGVAAAAAGTVRAGQRRLCNEIRV
jgi:hypothetical protein